jgi:hypothetical protein
MATNVSISLGDPAPPPAQKSNRAPVDLTQIQPVPWAWVDERIYAAIRGCSVKTIQRERVDGIGCRFKRINGSSVRYKMADIFAFLEAQPSVPAKRPRKPKLKKPAHQAVA